jgi:hypothetical protein
MRPRVLYKERTSFAWWAHVLVWGCVVIGGGSVLTGAKGGPGGPELLWTLAAPLGLVALVPLLFYGVFGALSTEVSEAGLDLKWVPFSLIKKFIPLDSITKAEAVTYRPLAEFGGWGIRGMGEKKAWTVRGNRAVRMELVGGNVFYLGSDRPERIAEWIRSAGRKKDE